MNGFFVVLEGGEGSGKTSILSAIASAMDIVATREPGGTPEGLALRSLLLSSASDWEPEAELLLMVAARAQHVTRVILPALRAGRVVVCDRFLGSTLAYQGAGRGLSVAKIEALHRDFVGGLMPDLTILLDVDPRIGLQRSRRRLGETAMDEGRFEALDFAFHERVRADFLAQAAAHPSRTVTIDAGTSLDRVVNDVVAILQERLT